MPGAPTGQTAFLQWPLVGRETELQRFREVLPGRGLVLAGPAGVGKTRLAVECLNIAKALGGEIAHVTASRAARALPLGALAPLLPPLDRGNAPRYDDRADLLRRTTRDLLERAGGRRLVLFVDDAHELDGVSATLVHQLAATNSAFVLVTVRTGEPAPDPIVALWKDELTERLEVRSLGTDTARTLLGSVLGGPVDPAAAAYLTLRSQGRVLFLRELVLGSVETGALRNDGGLWRIVGNIAPSDRLIALVESRLEGLSEPQRLFLEAVSLGEPLGPAELSAIGSPELVEVLERAGFLTSHRDGQRLQVRLAHPLFGEVLRHGVPAIRAQMIVRALADAVEATGARRREDPLRLGIWRLEGGGGRPDQLLAAAKIARWRYDFPLAEQLARAAVSTGAGFEAKLLVAQLMMRQGRYVELETELAALAAEANDDTQRGLVAIERLDALAFFRGQPEDALQIAEEATALIRDQGVNDLIAAKLATIRLAIDGPREAARVARPLLDRTQGRVLAWACVAAGFSLGRLGRLNEAYEVSVRGHAAHQALDRPLQWDPAFHVMFRCDCLAYAGRFAEAVALATEQYDEGVRNGSTEMQGYLAWHLGKFAADRGNVTAAIAHLLEATALFRQQPLTHEFIGAYLALAYGLAGQADRARATLREIETLKLPETFYMRSELVQAHAWTAVAEGDLPAAHEWLEKAARLGETSGDLVGAAAALHGLARLGMARGALPRLKALTAEVEGDLVRARCAHTQALANEDPEGLREVSESFERMGAFLLAAEAAADAAVVWKRTGAKRHATAAERRSAALMEHCEGARTPSLQSVGSRAGLTPAQRKVALLAAHGRNNKEIADQLSVSYRTVENQLHHVYQKLGISGREELAQALDVL